jgi:hypothetical membrane protein
MLKDLLELYKDSRIRAGSLFFLGGVVYLLGTDAADKIGSDLLWNGSIVLFGLLVIAGAYFALKVFKNIPFSALLVLAGIGMIGFGATQYGSTASDAFAAMSYFFFAIAAIWSSKMEKKPFSYISIILGAMALVALVIWASGFDFGPGGTYNSETADWLISPWLVCFGVYILRE